MQCGTCGWHSCGDKRKTINQNAITKLEEEAQRLGLRINETKTKYMVWLDLRQHQNYHKSHIALED